MALAVASALGCASTGTSAAARPPSPEPPALTAPPAPAASPSPVPVPAPSTAPVASSPVSSRPADHVFVLMLDGTRPDLLRRARIPNLRALSKAGTVYTQAKTVYPSQTRVAFVSLPTGAWPSAHGIPGGDEYKDAQWQTHDLGDDDPIAGQALCRRPTFFEEATAAGLTSVYAAMKGYELVGARGATWTINGGKTIDRIAYATRYMPAVEGSEALAVEHKLRLSADLLEQTLAIVRKEKPNLVVLNLGSADYTAHSLGPAHPAYGQALEFLDGLVGTLRAELAKLGILERTAIIVSADHGFTDVATEVVVAPVGKGEPQVAELARVGIEHFVTNTGGASMGLYLRDRTRLAEAVRILHAQAYTRGVHCEDAKAGCDRLLSELHNYIPDRTPHLIVDLDDDFALNRAQPGQHGSLRDVDMGIPMILSGAGVAPGRVLGAAHLIDVAPTVLKLLGLPGTILKPDGHALDEALAR